MRYHFNAMGFDDRVSAGELVVRVVLSEPPNADLKELRGPLSQIVQYVDRETGEVLAECHRFVFTAGERQGQLAASGRPDPKWLLVGDEEWNASHTDEDDPCEDCHVWRPLALGLPP